MATLVTCSYVTSTNSVKYNIVQLSCCGVVVITSVLHSEGLQFDPGQQHFFPKIVFAFKASLVKTVFARPIWPFLLVFLFF